MTTFNELQFNQPSFPIQKLQSEVRETESLACVDAFRISTGQPILTEKFLKRSDTLFKAVRKADTFHQLIYSALIDGNNQWPSTQKIRKEKSYT